MDIKKYERYNYCSTFSSEGGFWLILDKKGKPSDHVLDGKIVFKLPYLKEHDDLEEPPLELRQKYEELIEYKQGDKIPGCLNLVEAMRSQDDDCAFDQSCQYGHRVEGHAVYCHNDTWLYAPRKCRRTWYTGGRIRDEDCPGFLQNRTNNTGGDKLE